MGASQVSVITLGSVKIRPPDRFDAQGKRAKRYSLISIRKPMSETRRPCSLVFVTDLDLGSMLVPGWAKATCTEPVKASFLFRQHDSTGKPVAEAGVNATAVAATRFITFAEQAEGKTGTGVAYANPSETAAHVTCTAKDTAGKALASVARTRLPKGYNAHVMASLFGSMSFTGSLEVASTEPFVSPSLNFEAAPVFSSLPPGEVD